MTDCTAPKCRNDATGILMVRYSWKEQYRPHNRDGRYCDDHHKYFAPAAEGESYIAPLHVEDRLIPILSPV